MTGFCSAFLDMMMMMMMKEVKFSGSFDNRRFATLPMLSDNVIHQVSHNKDILQKYDVLR